MYQFKMDLHTHTIASGHGYSTLKENIEMAKKRGLLAYGLSEHGPAMPGGPHTFFFHNYKVIPRRDEALNVLCGIEANIMDMEGNLDLEPMYLEKMDYVIASMHIPCVKPGTKEENTACVLKVMDKPYVNIIGHPDDGRYPLDYERIVRAAKEKKVLLELNNCSVGKNSPRKNCKENMREILRLCKEYGTPIIVGTDSHICGSIGDFTDAIRILEEVDFPAELIINENPDRMKEYGIKANYPLE